MEPSSVPSSLHLPCARAAAFPSLVRDIYCCKNLLMVVNVGWRSTGLQPMPVAACCPSCWSWDGTCLGVPHLGALHPGWVQGQPSLLVPGARCRGQSTGICPLQASHLFATKFMRSDTEITGMGRIKCNEGKTTSKHKLATLALEEAVVGCSPSPPSQAGALLLFIQGVTPWDNARSATAHRAPRSCAFCHSWLNISQACRRKLQGFA